MSFNASVVWALFKRMLGLVAVSGTSFGSMVCRFADSVIDVMGSVRTAPAKKIDRRPSSPVKRGLDTRYYRADIVR